MESRRTTLKIGTNENAVTGDDVHWIMFTIRDREYAIVMPDVGHKDGTRIDIDKTNHIMIRAVYHATQSTVGCRSRRQVVRLLTQQRLKRSSVRGCCASGY
jgi:hypothetical protein